MSDTPIAQLKSLRKSAIEIFASRVASTQRGDPCRLRVALKIARSALSRAEPTAGACGATMIVFGS